MPFFSVIVDVIVVGLFLFPACRHFRRDSPARAGQPVLAYHFSISFKRSLALLGHKLEPRSQGELNLDKVTWSKFARQLGQVSQESVRLTSRSTLSGRPVRLPILPIEPSSGGGILTQTEQHIESDGSEQAARAAKPKQDGVASQALPVDCIAS